MICLTGAVAATIAFGLLGVGRLHRWVEDFRWYYAGGLTWLAGQSPYVPEQFNHHFAQVTGTVTQIGVLAYPPTFAPLCMALALLEMRTAAALFTALNLAAVAGLALLGVRWVTQAHRPRPASHAPTTRWLLPCLVFGLVGTWNGLWQGQVTALVGVSLIGGFYAVQRGRWLLGGVLPGLASIKPQLLALPVLWLLLERQWRAPLVAGGVGLALAAYPMVLLGPVQAVTDWLGSMQNYQTPASNQLGNEGILGLPSLAASLGLPVPGPGVSLALVMVLVTAAVPRLRRRLGRDDVLGLLMGLYVALVFGRSHELLLVAVPMGAALWLHLGHRRRAWPALIAGVVLLNVPERVIGLMEMPVLLHWRTLVVWAGVAGLAWLSWRGGEDAGAGTGPAGPGHEADEAPVPATSIRLPSGN